MATRRSNGEGTKPYKTSDGRWRADYLVGYDPASGRRIRKSVYAKTRPLCADRLRDALRAVDDGLIMAGKAPTFEEWTRHWVYKIVEPNLAHNTFLGYESSLSAWVWGTRLGSKRLDKLTPEDFDGLYERMRAKQRKPDTIMGVHRTVSRALTVAVQRRRLGRSPLEKYALPTRSSDTVDQERVITPDEARGLISLADSLPRNEGVRWMVALLYGPRQSERLGLGWDKVDLDAREIHWHRKLYRRRYRHGCADPSRCPAKNGKGHLCPKRTGGGQHFGALKSAASKRSNAIPEPLLRPLQELRSEWVDAGSPTYTDPTGVEVPLVFWQAHGAPMRSEIDLREWHAFLKHAGVARHRVHNQRHTAATVALMMGVSERVVMDMMGWSQVSMLKRYQHVIDDMRRDAAQVMGEALWSAPSNPEPDPDPSDTVVELDAFRRRRAG